MIRKALPLVLAVALAGAGVAGARHPRDPREAFTTADRAWAQRIVLEAGDLPGQWGSSKPAPDDDERCASFDPDQSDLVLTGEAVSRDFARGGVFVSSSAEVYRTPRDVAESFRRMARPQFVRCLEQAFAGQDGFTRVSGRIVPFPVVGVRRLALRVALTLVQGGQSVRVYADFVGWDRGRASASVVVLRVGAPPSRALELRLARRMDARMRR